MASNSAQPGALWTANGDPARDLPAWVHEEMAHGAVLSSAAVEMQGCAGSALAELAMGAYTTALQRAATPPARIWTFLPGIASPGEAGLDSYMHLNIGRARAYRAAGWGERAKPAGTCVGHAGTRLVIHALAVSARFTPVENPRQRPAWRYSSKFGPEAPLFSRGVLCGGRLWASGTASVVGEETLHGGDLPAQWAETMENLESLRRSAEVGGSWKHMRAYVRDAAHCEAVRALGAGAFAGGLEELLHAPLCRTDLLVEVEGVASA